MSRKYLSVGKDEIREDSFYGVMDTDKLKPNGGLWLTQHVSEDFNSWVDCILYDEDLRYLWFKDRTRKNFFEQPCCAVSLIHKAHLYVLHNDQSFDYLMKCFSSNGDFFSYENLSKFYDGIYVSLSGYLYHDYKEIVSKMRSEFVEDSLLLFNLDCINYYQSGKVCIPPFDYECGERPGSYEIKLDNTRKRVLKKGE